MTSAFISEIYASVQGEGPYAGERQVFVRLAGCPLRCAYCDTPESLTARGHERWTIEKALARVLSVARLKKIKTVSVTGGEPLAQPLFVKEFLAALKMRKFRTYLETAGVHPDALKSVIKNADVVSMDMKLPSATGSGHWRKHADFLKAGRGKIFVKIVIEKKSTLSEVVRAVGMLSRVRPSPALVLQPATPIEGQVEGPSAEQVADAYAAAAAKLPRVSVIPQQHKLWGVR